MHMILFITLILGTSLFGASISADYKNELSEKHQRQVETFSKDKSQILENLEPIDAFAYSFIMNKKGSWTQKQLSASAVFGTVSLLSYIADSSQENLAPFYFGSLALLPYIFFNPYAASENLIVSAYKTPFQVLKDMARRERYLREIQGGSLIVLSVYSYIFPSYLTPFSPRAGQEWVLASALMVWGASYLFFPSEAERFVDQLYEAHFSNNKVARNDFSLAPIVRMRDISPSRHDTTFALALDFTF